MTDLLLPPWLNHARVAFRYVDSTGRSIAEFTGASVTGAKGGDRLAASLEFTAAGGASTTGRMERAAIRSFLTRLRGRQNRPYLFDPSYQRRGSFPTGELLANNTFANGPTGWSTGTGYSLQVQDRTAISAATGEINNGIIRRNALVNVTQYAPHVCRLFISSIVPPAGNIQISHTDSAGASAGTIYANSGSLAPSGLLTFTHVAIATSESVRIGASSSQSIVPARYSIPYISYARCALVDAGANQFTRSDEIDHADWTKSNFTVTANYYTAPDGSATGDKITETAAASVSHQVLQDKPKSAVAQDWALAVAVRVGDGSVPRANILLSIGDSTNTDTARAIIDVSAGTITSTSVTGSGLNAQAFVRSLGNNWYYCCVVGLIPASATTIRGRIVGVQGTSVTTYTGDVNANYGIWRMTLAQSSVPMRLVQTTSAGTNGASPTGSTMYVKGGPASALGSLLVDDQFEIITSRGSELKILTAPVDFDAAGLGYVLFEPPLRGTVADNAAIIVHQPMGRFLFSGDVVGWEDTPGVITQASAEFEEA